MDKVSPQIRILAVVLVLVGAAGMLAMRMMGPSVPAVEAAPPAATHTAPKPAKAAKPMPAKAAKPKPAKAATPAKPKVKPAKAATPARALNAPVPATGFPPAVDAALRKHKVVVVSLVVPGARVDQLAAAEAQAGAKLGGAGYLALNVLNEKVARALLNKLEGLKDPSVLVLKRSGEVALGLEGFVDRETVAQAAANASS